MCRSSARLELSRVLIPSLPGIRTCTPLEVSLFPNLSTTQAEVWHKYVRCSMDIQVNKREDCHKGKYHRTAKQKDPNHGFHSTCLLATSQEVLNHFLYNPQAIYSTLVPDYNLGLSIFNLMFFPQFISASLLSPNVKFSKLILNQ